MCIVQITHRVFIVNNKGNYLDYWSVLAAICVRCHIIFSTAAEHCDLLLRHMDLLYFQHKLLVESPYVCAVRHLCHAMSFGNDRCNVC